MTGSCLWQEDIDGLWETDCGQLFYIEDGAPSENKMHYCCYCGAPLEERRYQSPVPDEDAP